jgi:hypothetical protein
MVGCQNVNKEAPKPADEAAKKVAVAEAEKAAPASPAAVPAPPVVTPVSTPPPAPAAPKPSGPSGQIKFENTVHDLGDVKPDSKNIATYTFTNIGKGTLKILDIQKTCGCTVPQLAKYDYAPGESGTIRVEYQASKLSGPILKHLFVMSNDPNNPRVEITVKANIVVKVEVEPRTVQFRFDTPEANMPVVTLFSKDNKPFSIKSIESNGNAVTADIDPNVSATKFTVRLKADMEKLKTNMNGTIKFNITHPDIDMLLVSYTTIPEFDTQPPSIIVRAAAAGKAEQRELWVKNNYNEPFEIESTSSKNGYIKVLKQEKTDNMYKLAIEITPPELQKLMFFSDVLKINVKGKTPIEVVCRGFNQRKR